MTNLIFFSLPDHGAAANIGWDNDDWGEPSNAANWFDNVGQVQPNIVQAQPEQPVAVPEVENITEIQRALEAKEAECLALTAQVDTFNNIQQNLQAKIDDLSNNTDVLQEKMAVLESSLLLKKILNKLRE